jgi:hypothetical protein
MNKIILTIPLVFLPSCGHIAEFAKMSSEIDFEHSSKQKEDDNNMNFNVDVVHKRLPLFLEKDYDFLESH